MKKLSILICMMAWLVACDDDNNNLADEKVKQVQQAVAAGQWRITYFFDTDSNQTSNFTGYIFEFGAGNALTATNGSNNYLGTWSVTDDDNSKDDNNNAFDDIDFNIGFTTPPNFVELSEDWEILSQSATKIELRHVSGGNGGTDFLTFEKI